MDIKNNFTSKPGALFEGRVITDVGQSKIIIFSTMTWVSKFAFLLM